MTAGSIPQRLTPGLLGMAVHTDCAYLHAMQKETSLLREKSLSSLAFHLFTLDFAALVDEIRARDWPAAQRRVVDGAARLERAGADFLVVTSNTGSAFARDAADLIALPILGIAGTLYRSASKDGLSRLGLLSTMRTWESGMFQQEGARHGVEVVEPSAAIAADIEDLIFTRLIRGEVTQDGFDRVLRAVDWFAAKGADGVALACTDLTHLADGLDGKAALPVLDTTLLHARAAARVALGTETL